MTKGKKCALTPKQKKFADLYLADGNATQAYKKTYATTNDKVAGSNANRLLKNERVLDYIKQKQPKIQKQLDFTVDWLRQEVLKVINDSKSRPVDKLRGYEILGKTLGAFVEKKELYVPKDEDFVIEVVKGEEDSI